MAGGYGYEGPSVEFCSLLGHSLFTNKTSLVPPASETLFKSAYTFPLVKFYCLLKFLKAYNNNKCKY